MCLNTNIKIKYIHECDSRLTFTIDTYTNTNLNMSIYTLQNIKYTQYNNIGFDKEVFILEFGYFDINKIAYENSII